MEEFKKRKFESGANRNDDSDKLDYEGFLSPLALFWFGCYMHRNRFLEDGSLRDSDNWKKGIPLDSYMKSLFRHFMDVWFAHSESNLNQQTIEDALCGVLFNAFGYLHEVIKNPPKYENVELEPEAESDFDNLKKNFDATSTSLQQQYDQYLANASQNIYNTPANQPIIEENTKTNYEKLKTIIFGR